MLENSTKNFPVEVKNIIDEIIEAYNENRLVTVQNNDPTFWQIVEKDESDLKKIYIRFKPKKKV